jgi:transposase
MYDAPFKLHICKVKDEHPEKTFKQLGAEYGVGGSTISDWYRRYRLYGENAFDPEALRLENEKRLLALMKEVDDLKEENEILKKAMAFFAKSDQ